MDGMKDMRKEKKKKEEEHSGTRSTQKDGLNVELAAGRVPALEESDQAEA
jgi:hypothetical protein